MPTPPIALDVSISSNVDICTNAITTSDPGSDLIISAGSGNQIVISGTSAVTASGFGSSNTYGTGGTSGNWQYIPPQIVQQPAYVTLNDAFKVETKPADKLKSEPKETGPTAHSLSGVLRIYGDAVVVEYYCSHCKDVLHRQVISKVPKSIIEKSCLPRIVEGV